MGADQGQLFNPDIPPEAYSKEEGNARLKEIRAKLGSSMHRYDTHEGFVVPSHLFNYRRPR